MNVYELFRGADLLGRIEQTGRDFPWSVGRFQAAPAFGGVSGLFAKEHDLLEADRLGEEWEAVWDEIERPGLRLIPADGGEPIAGLLIHISGGEAWWRY